MESFIRVVFIVRPNHIYIFHANGCCTQYILMIYHMNHLHNLQDKFACGYKLLNEYHSAQKLCPRLVQRPVFDLGTIPKSFIHYTHTVIREFSIGFVNNNSIILTIKGSYQVNKMIIPCGQATGSLTWEWILNGSNSQRQGIVWYLIASFFFIILWYG